MALPASSSILSPLWALKEALLILGRPFLWRESRCRHHTHLKITKNPQPRCGWGSPISSYSRFKFVP